MNIYIPVWIDLKSEIFKADSMKLKNLHSSMDRFEEGSETNLTAREIIYIPVWIDLKRQKFRKYLRG